MKSATQTSYKQRILRVLIHIQKHLDDNVSLPILAEVAHFSPYHFHRVFRGMVGESVAEHVRRLRLERAAYQLASTRHPVTEIAFSAGYQTHESFTRAFREMFGDNPSIYRKKHIYPIKMPRPAGVSYQPQGTIDDFIPKDTGGIHMDVKIKKYDPARVAFIRHIGPYATCGAAWERLCAWAGPQELLGPEAQFLGICHDDPEITPPEKIRYDACLVVGEKIEPEGEVGVQEITGGDYAVTVHQGPYEALHDTYAKLCGEWMPASGREKRSLPSVEVYLNDPNSTAPAELLTEIRLALD